MEEKTTRLQNFLIVLDDWTTVKFEHCYLKHNNCPHRFGATGPKPCKGNYYDQNPRGQPRHPHAKRKGVLGILQDPSKVQLSYWLSSISCAMQIMIMIIYVKSNVVRTIPTKVEE